MLFVVTSLCRRWQTTRKTYMLDCVHRVTRAIDCVRLYTCLVPRSVIFSLWDNLELDAGKLFSKAYFVKDKKDIDDF